MNPETVYYSSGDWCFESHAAPCPSMVRSGSNELELRNESNCPYEIGLLCVLW